MPGNSTQAAPRSGLSWFGLLETRRRPSGVTFTHAHPEPKRSARRSSRSRRRAGGSFRPRSSPMAARCRTSRGRLSRAESALRAHPAPRTRVQWLLPRLPGAQGRRAGPDKPSPPLRTDATPACQRARAPRHRGAGADVRPSAPMFAAGREARSLGGSLAGKSRGNSVKSRVSGDQPFTNTDVCPTLAL